MTSSLDLPVVAIVGRPNVGKSALFNRLVGSRVALVEDLPGTTRDRVYGEYEWNGQKYVLIDTGGLDESGALVFSPLVREQIMQAVSQADVVLFMVDAAAGVVPSDNEAADLLRRSQRPLIVVANKADNEAREQAAVAFYELGAGDPVAVSAQHGLGIGDLLDRIAEVVGERPAVPSEKTDEVGVAIVGRPNVGKSALLNAILGEDRVIVSEIPGTTRDAIDTVFEYEGRTLRLIDTAGIRRRGKVERGVEKHSVMRSQDAIERCDVAAVVVDATDPLTAQDVHVIGYADQAAKGLVVVFNKWDLLEDPEESAKYFIQLLRSKVKFAAWAFHCFTSATNKRGIPRLLELALTAAAERERRLPTNEVNAVVRRALSRHAPPMEGKRQLKVLYVTQAEVSPPTFVFFVNDPELVHFSFRRYIENQLREAFGFQGTAIRVIFRGRSEEE
ncbi:MAG TPA: ribosome biogenesis GTPase Der [Dehalococcoidia bacterium]|nr:ribosome biogenesis GTPase Der [Dehalococcoidia bacterium]